MQPAATKTTNPRGRKGALGLIFFIMLMDIAGLSILFPIAPYIVQKYSHDALMVTMLSVIYAAAQFISAPILGKISDRTGRRPVLLVCVLGSAVGYFIFSVGGALWVLFLSRLIDGITGGNLSTATAYIVDGSKPEERAKNMTIIGMAYGLGFILGPALGGTLGQINVIAPVYAAGILSLASAVMIYFLLPESLAPGKRETAPLRLKDFNPLASVSYMLRKPGLGIILLVYALFNLSFDGVNSTLGIFLIHKFAIQPWQIGALFVVTGIATALIQALFVNKLVTRYGEKRMALASLVGTTLGALGIMSVPVFWMLFPVGFLQSAITGFIWSTVGAMAANQVSEREQGQLAGVNAALGGLMAALGPLWAGAVYDHVMPTAPYWMGAAIFIVAILVLAQVKVPRLAPRPVQQPAGND